VTQVCSLCGVRPALSLPRYRHGRSSKAARARRPRKLPGHDVCLQCFQKERDSKRRVR
jgi:hypothetical protein